MVVQGRKRVDLGILELNFRSVGFLRWEMSSYSWHVGPWSWNSKTRRQRVDIPGPWSWRQDKPRSRGGG